MASLLLVVFIVELVVQLVNSIGAATINHMLWRIFLCIPTSLAREFRDQRKKQAEYLTVRRELRATSGQDQFAKWARLDRQHNKLLDELQKQKTSLDASRARFDSYLTSTRLICTRGLQWLLPFWYSRQPMFWLPYGLFPYYAEWFASFPRAPMGSVSIHVWQWACSGVLALVVEALAGALGLVAALRQWQRRRRSRMMEGRTAQAVPAAGAGGRGVGGVGAEAAEAKKML